MSLQKYKVLLKERRVVLFVASIVVGMFLSGYAMFLQRTYNNAPSKFVDPNLEGFAVARAQNSTDLEIDYLLMAIVLEPPTLAISGQFEIEKNGTYGILFRFPFRIKEINSSTSAPVHADFQLINNQTYGSLFLIEIDARNLWTDKLKEYISYEFPIEETFTSGRRGNYFANLRFTYLQSIGTILLDTIDIESTLISLEYLESLVSIKNFFVFFLYPERITITQAFPHFTVGPIKWPSPSYMPNMTSINWYFEELEARELSMLVYYNDNDEYDKYQLMLFNSGLWYGLGFSIVIAGVFEFVRTLLSPSESKTVKKAEKKRTGRKKDS